MTQCLHPHCPDKGPALKASPDAIERFLDQFFLMHPSVNWGVIRRSESQALACDTVWWTERLLNTLAKSEFSSTDRLTLLYLALEQMHQQVWLSSLHGCAEFNEMTNNLIQCRWYSGCRSYCKHWTRGILDTCRRNGWIVPGAMYLWFWQRFDLDNHRTSWRKLLKPGEDDGSRQEGDNATS